MDFDADEKAEQAQRFDEIRRVELDDVRVLLRCESGRRFFRRLMVHGQIFQTTFSTDHSQASFKEGHRNFALRLFNDVVEIAPEHVATLMTGREDIAQ